MKYYSQGSGRNPDNRRFIEVKSTTYYKLRFYWSRNERKVASIKKNKYWIYCYTNVDLNANNASGPIKINNPITKIGALNLVTEPMDILYYAK